MLDRNTTNAEILNEIAEMVRCTGDFRFIQLLWALDCVDGTDRFHEESTETLKRIQAAKRKIWNEKGEDTE